MELNKIFIICIVAYIIYLYYVKTTEPIKLKSILKKEKQYYEISTITNSTILLILLEKFIKYKYSNFNLNNLPVTSKPLKLTEADKLGNSILNVFNRELKNSFIKLRLIQTVPLYKIETDLESNYSLQMEFEVKTMDETIGVENRLLRLQTNVIVQKKNNDETFFDKVIIGKNNHQINKIFLSQIKEISELDNSYQLTAFNIHTEMNKKEKNHKEETGSHFTKNDY